MLTPLRDLFAAMFFVFFGLTTDSVGTRLDAPAGARPRGRHDPHEARHRRVRRATGGRRHDSASGAPASSLAPRGEFSIVIAGLAVGAGVAPALAPLATAYVLITIIAGTFLVEASRCAVVPRRRAQARGRAAARSVA